MVTDKEKSFFDDEPDFFKDKTDGKEGAASGQRGTKSKKIEWNNPVLYEHRPYSSKLKYYSPLQAVIASVIFQPFVLIWIVWHNFKLIGSHPYRNLLLCSLAGIKTFQYFLELSQLSGYRGAVQDIFLYASWGVSTLFAFFIVYKFQKPAFDEFDKQRVHRRHSHFFLLVLAVCFALLHSSTRYPMIDALHRVAPTYFLETEKCTGAQDGGHSVTGMIPRNSLVKFDYINCEIKRSPLIGLVKWVFH